MSKERLDDIVDGLLNNRLELTSFVSESLEQAERVQDQQATIDSLSMAHDAIHREMPKDKHTLIKNLIRLNKRVQELEDIIYQDERQAVLEGLYEQNKRYRATINAMRQILKDAIHSLDVGEKVQGLEYGVKMANEALEGEE